MRPPPHTAAPLPLQGQTPLLRVVTVSSVRGSENRCARAARVAPAQLPPQRLILKTAWAVVRAAETALLSVRAANVVARAKPVRLNMVNGRRQT